MAVTLMSSPRLTPNDVGLYSERYSYALEGAVEALVSGVQERGYLTKEELSIVGEWKSPRIRSKIARNSDEMVQEVTQLALGTHSVQLAVHLPQALVGVGMPVASTILHWFHTDPFPVLDFRALWSLGIEMSTCYSLNFWEQYVLEVRALAATWHIDMRTLDRALWQYSSEHQPSAT